MGPLPPRVPAPKASAHRRSARPAVSDPALVRVGLIGLVFAFLGLLVVIPLGSVFLQALDHGLPAYLKAIVDDATLSAIALTFTTAAIAVPLNVVFGVAAAWLLSRFEFPAKRLLTTLIDLPFSVSPVIAGLIFVLLFGSRGLFGAFLSNHDIQVIFAVPGVILATTFVTFPFVAREVLTVMEAQGADQEEAALTLGATGPQVLLRVTLPRIKWALLYGTILCNARAMGEFGAVSVVSGHIRGETNTVPLHVEILYNEYNFVGAFAVASLLALLALATLFIKKFIEHKDPTFAHGAGQ